MRINWFLITIALQQILASLFSVIKHKDLFTASIYILYAIANIIFAFGPEIINKVVK